MSHVLPLAPCPGSSDPAMVAALCSSCDRRAAGVPGKPLKPGAYFSWFHGAPRCVDHIELLEKRIDAAREHYAALIRERVERRDRVLNPAVPRLVDAEEGGVD